MSAAAQDELNVYQSAEARFEIAAQKLDLEDGLYRYLRYPSKEITVYIPVPLSITASSRYSPDTACCIPRFAARAKAEFDLLLM